MSKLTSSYSGPKDFWKTLDNLQQCAHGKSKEINDLPAENWLQHFKTLMHKGNINLNQSQHKIMEFIENDKKWMIFNELNYRINSEKKLQKQSKP